jgi:hypothetical protein
LTSTGFAVSKGFRGSLAISLKVISVAHRREGEDDIDDA